MEPRPATYLHDHFWAVVPAGGSGTRLWPLSRSSKPKFLLPLLGDRTLLQQTVDRLALLAPPERTLVVCGYRHAGEVMTQLPELPPENIIIEPSPKGSGPAIGLATLVAESRDPLAIIGSFAADHVVLNQAHFESASQDAIQAAELDWLVTIGLRPTRPETGYGYIERTDSPISPHFNGRVYRTRRFVEKPDLARAKAFLESGRFDWNASMFFWKAVTLRSEMARLLPELLAGLQRILDRHAGGCRLEIPDQLWSKLEESTIDQGIMERSERVAVVPADLGWSDVGDWDGLGQIRGADSDGNSAQTKVVALESTGNVCWSTTALPFALLGVEDLIIVHTETVLLIARRDKAQQVKAIVGNLSLQGMEELVL